MCEPLPAFLGRKPVPITDTNNIGGLRSVPGIRDRFRGRIFSHHAQDSRDSYLLSADEPLGSSKEAEPLGPLNDIAYVWKAAEVCCAADSEASIRARKMSKVVR